MSQEYTGIKKNLFLFITIGLTCIFLVGLFSFYYTDAGIFSKDSKSASETVKEIITEIDQRQAAVIESVRAREQYVDVSLQQAGEWVMIDKVKVSASSWIAVHDDVYGEVGLVLGARRIDAGEYSDLQVPLLRATIPVGTYIVGIYRDDGDRQFERHADEIQREKDGEMISDTFSTF
jgi:protein-disulfide isomerase